MSATSTLSVGELIHCGEAALQTGPFGTQLSASEYVEIGVPVINVRNIGFGDIRAGDLEYITEVKAEKLHHHILRTGDIVFGRKGAVERHALIAADQDGWVQGSDCLRLRLSSTRVDRRYLSYYLRTQAHQDWMQALCSFGATMSSLNQDIVARIRFPAPLIAAQQKIAAMLSAYDDLIANNQRRIALLETMAEEIYREWFVRMRFPSCGTAEIEHLLPVGWSRKPLGELSALIKRGVSPDYSDMAEGIVLNQKCIRDGKVSLSEARQHQTRVPDEKLVQYGDVLINSTGVGTLGRVAVFDIERSGITCDSHITILRPNGVAVQPVYLGHTIAQLQGYFESMAAGSTGQAELSRDLISRTKVVVPDAGVQSAFAAYAMPMRQQRRAMLQANEALARARDALLPRLISGKLKVDHLDIRLPPAMQASATA